MPVHPSLHNYENTLANALMYYFAQKGEAFIFRCINRIDRDTTGLVLVAKHAISAGILSGQMQRREISRTYYALVSPIPAKTQGTIDAPITRKGESVIEREVNFKTGERAVTHYKVLQTSAHYPCALLSLTLDTGRTHQIRVHMQYIGCPLVGDSLYDSDTKYPDNEIIHKLMNRQALHSGQLTFRHPVTGKEMTFTSKLPEDMRSLL
jgi:23S rRNA pseudouridine1911/1915/1917 synthase